jgi:uncharacterized protein YutE (UPF0331/DUF86 family)
MQNDNNKVIRRIDELMNLESGRDSEIVSGTINILEQLYGGNSHKTKAFLEQHAACCKQKDHNDMRRALENLAYSTKGVLQSVKSEVEAGLVENIQLQAQGGVFGDFITAARQALEENNKDVAAVLACAALEDALKRYAEQKGLNVSDADMSQVVNALKSQGLLKDPQASIVQSYVKLRNKAFHAEWGKIEKESVNSAIGFTEQFILSNFS